VADEYEKNRAFGKPENIEKRLAMWVAQLSTDRTYPWVGLGLIDDLKCACRMLGGDPDKRYIGPKEAPRPAPAAVAKEVEYDL
jgi:hypothetical protein